MHWFACHTEAQKESLAARELRREGFEVFYPHTTEWVGTGHKAKSRLVRRSWFSRYLFTRCSAEQLGQVNDTPGVSTVVFAPGGEPYPVPEKAMQLLWEMTDHLGEVFIGKTVRPKPKYRVGDLIRITDEKSPLFGLYVQAKLVLDNGTVHAMFMGEMVGGGKIILPDSIEGEVVQGAA